MTDRTEEGAAMSYSEAEMTKLGTVNQGWGVCGFTSTFYSMYAVNPGKRAMLLGAYIPTKVLAEIKTYLMMLKADANLALLGGIETFTRSFGPDFASFSIDTYIEHVNGAVSRSDAEIVADRKYGIAMPPEAVGDYVRRIWDHKADVQAATGDSGADGIVGVRKEGGGATLHGGLVHWMYRHNGTVYSWGRSFPSIAHANKDYRLCWLIRITA